MMLRSLVDEVVRRRLWPIPLAAILIAIAAPVLFMKSAPADAPAANEAPPPAAPGDLPQTAEKLVTTSDKAVVPHQTSKPKPKDPFAPPASAKSTTTPAQATSPQPTSKAATSTPKAIPLVITNAKGQKLTVAPSKSKSSTAKKTTPPPPPAQPLTPVATKGVVYVDVRYGEQEGTKVRRHVPRMQTFRAGGKVAAIFLKYSPSRRKAVFAIAPSTKVSGDVKCRRKEGACRYVDIPEGKHVRLTMRGADGTVVSRRLDVVGIHGEPIPVAAAPATAPLSTPLEEAKCLLKRLLTLSPIVPSIPVDACA